MIDPRGAVIADVAQQTCQIASTDRYDDAGEFQPKSGIFLVKLDAEQLLEPKSPLFRTITRHGTLTGQRLAPREALAMVKRRSHAAGIGRHIRCHSLRATGITNFLQNGGSLENAQAIAAHESPRTIKLYDRTRDELNLDEIERVRF